MTKEQFAQMLDGRQYGKEMSLEDMALAKEHGLVVVHGASANLARLLDDLMLFNGAIHNEVECYDGGIAYLDKDELWYSRCDCEDCPYAEEERAKCKTITAIWCPPSGGSWVYETDIPHATFNIYEDGELYCVGIVFEVGSLQ